jgi:uncharacterized membrane protein (UPF0127 family)
MKTYRLDCLSLLRVLAATVLLAGATHAAAETRLKTTTLRLGPHALKVEVVRTDEDRARGLMHRPKLDRDAGMLFIFDEPAYHSMWMKNTLIPLSVAFVDAQGAILNILDMEPQTLDSHLSAGPSVYAI